MLKRGDPIYYFNGFHWKQFTYLDTQWTEYMIKDDSGLIITKEQYLEHQLNSILPCTKNIDV